MISAVYEPRRIYAIGDTHGRADLLDRMVAEIARDLSAHPADDALTVTVGDYVDRGPDSRGVIERLMRNPFATRFVALKGNHESLLESFLRDSSTADYWRRLGGLETLHSYGVDVGPLMRGRRRPKRFARRCPQAMSSFWPHSNCRCRSGDIFCAMPGCALAFHWSGNTRTTFCGSATSSSTARVDFGKIVVHGHTPTEEPELRSNRVNVDTGAFMTDRLTCAVLEEKGVRFLMATDQ